MKKLFALMLLLLSVSCAYCEESNVWRTAPVITKAYELSAGKLYLEWNGQAPVYQVYMDGRSVANVIVSNAVIDVKKGTHTILVYPINEAKAADTKVDIGVGSNSFIGGNLEVDLALLGLDPKNLSAGAASVPLNIDYTPDPIFSTAPSEISASTDWNNMVHLSFTDRYYSDEYVVTIKVGKDTSYVRFSTNEDESSKYISKSNSTVSLTLEPDYLVSQECIIPELDTKYSFSVQLRKYAKNLINGESIIAAIHTSKDSSAYQYTPIATWKTAPVVSFASQTADGQITLQWTHDADNIQCEYAIMKLKKTMGIKTGEEEVGVVSENSFVINDLLNGKYDFTIIPRFNNEQGIASSEISVEVKNDWVVAPTLSCVQTGPSSLLLTWMPEPSIEYYHVTVYSGDNASILRFVNLDFKKYAEHELRSTGSQMEFAFTYPEAVVVEDGQKLKFEVYGIRRTAAGEEQKTATSSHIITLETANNQFQ